MVRRGSIVGKVSNFNRAMITGASSLIDSAAIFQGSLATFICLLLYKMGKSWNAPGSQGRPTFPNFLIRPPEGCSKTTPPSLTSSVFGSL